MRGGRELSETPNGDGTEGERAGSFLAANGDEI